MILNCQSHFLVTFQKFLQKLTQPLNGNRYTHFPVQLNENTLDHPEFFFHNRWKLVEGGIQDQEGSS